MIHPSTELRFVNSQIGYGVYATEFIRAGTITWALCDLDQLIGQARFDALPDFTQKYLYKYAYVDASGQRVLCWDTARFINHHCEANCLPVGGSFEIAVRDIEPGEQLTDEYGGLNIEESFECRCGSERCRGQIHPTDVLQYADVWNSQVASVLPLLSGVAQPLWSVVEKDPELLAILAGRGVPSVKSQYRPQAQAATGR